jgi:hypothetical protein
MRAIESAGPAWVSRNRELVDLAVAQFQATGQWPQIRELQRQLDRQGLDCDVAAAACSMPLLTGGTCASPAPELAIPLWLLRFADTGQQLAQVALIIIKRAVMLYLSPDLAPHLRSDDPAILQQAAWPELVLRAGDLVGASQPTPFASGTSDEGGWDYTLHEEFTSRLKGVRTLDDYVRCQAQWLKNSANGQSQGTQLAAAGPGRNSAGESDRSQSSWPKVIIAGAFALAAGILGPATAIWISHDGTGAPPAVLQHSPAPESAAGIPIDPHVQLSRANLCSWRLATHPMPLASARPVRVRIDDRCNYPEDPNPATDSPTGVFSIAAQKLSAQVASIRDGQLVTLRCYVTNGMLVSDAAGNRSRIWLGLVSPHGLMPDVDVGGGYSIAQLGKLGLSRCSG